MSELRTSQPMVDSELWEAMAALPRYMRPKIGNAGAFTVNLFGGQHNGEVMRRLSAALFADPGLVTACVRKAKA